MLLLVLLVELSLVGSAWSSPFKVLVVMSYEQNNPWCQEIKEGIERILRGKAELSWFYMDTKARLAGGPEKARQAFALFQQLAPDGVIAADDNAQSMFVVPYLKDAVETPVSFCGVNADAERFGYPNDHISGILERGHIRESIAFAQQLVPDIKRVCFIAKSSPSGEAMRDQVETERDRYPAEFERFDLVMSLSELRKVAQLANHGCDALYVDSLEGIVNEHGHPLAHREIYPNLSQAYQGPVLGANRYHVELGALSAVVKTGQEQGETAATMLLRAMQGTPMSELPMTRNFRGRRLINVDTLKKMGIQPRPILLRGVTLVGGRGE